MARASLLVLPTLLLLACQETGRDLEAFRVDTLEGGTPRVTNEARAEEVAESWTASEDLRIGALRGDGPEGFSQVRDLEVGPSGRIYVLDQISQEIRVFDRNGEHLFTFGGKGGGPGELQDANGITWGPEGALWVNDPRNNRLSAFDTEGKLLRTTPRFVGGYSWLWSGGVDARGRLYDTQIHSAGPYSNQPGVEYPDYDLFLKRFDPETEAVDSFELHYTPTPFYRVSRGALPIPFARSEIREILPTGEMWVGHNDAYRIARTDLRGDTLLVVEKKAEPVPVSEEERETGIARIEGLQDRMNDDTDLDYSAIPETHPAFQYFFVDDRGRLWVRPSVEALRFDVFGTDGRLEAVVELGFSVNGVPRPVVRNGWLYGVSTDSLDVGYVVGGELRSRH